MDISQIVKPEKSKGGVDCALCENKISAGERVLSVSVVVGASFMKALQKTVRREIHLNCAMSAHEIIGQKIDEAVAL